MEAQKFKTIEDLEEAWLKDERLELINGEIVKRPMASFEHGAIQGDIRAEIDLFRRKNGSGGWWFATEVSVCYNEHQTPIHDVAGWRKERVPEPPKGVVNITPDWVCEIVSPGHENKDTIRNFNTLRRYNVPYYWLIWPENKVLIAYKLVDGKYLVIESVEDGGKLRIEPFEEIEFDLGYILGIAD
jgi:Uma2 family endonuclease